MVLIIMALVKMDAYVQGERPTIFLKPSSKIAVRVEREREGAKKRAREGDEQKEMAHYKSSLRAMAF